MESALILIVEDEPEIASILDAYFTRDGFRTVLASNGEIALQHHAMLSPDLMVLDVKLPKADGFAVLAEIRHRGGTPVIMATALAEDLDKLSALRLGADDYVVKPFNPLEVVERAKAILRRGRMRSDGVVRHGPLELDSAAHAAYVQAGGRRQLLNLTTTEFKLLAHMMRTPTKAFSRGELLDACMPDSDALERTVDSHVSNLRRKLHVAGANDLLGGVRGVGYRLLPL
ncbi:DNA-binding response regulator [Sphingomonas koreensis]|jgi:two-component system response regulator AdeR|uniref:DNA-binding response regulator n=1 Tax=Sphingomonas koreensis TaxID=93064 RepID=A0A1L6JDA3_9SPHN|nr:response regulator [Sphingomonas koreensis]APR53912.1 DNA-binding response regulator [Sphingomonas koreensis]MDC7808857.1 response regulator [Sphingomonas koreensis]RSU18979.1 DNA-binding response regulator [Sphingomonas koreensis]RSU24054.1 DNA-binding response regulator [Sphingomonas koreensis]RSU26305.1 DNA-binding response regulator [Sphingomonas koreensis]